MKKMLLLCAVFLLPVISLAQTPWDQAGAFPSADFMSKKNAKVNWDGHGVAVDPDGKIWYQPYYATDSTNVSWQAKKVATRVIYVFNPDGTEAPFSPVKYIDLPGGKRDTLGGVTIKNAAGARSFDPNTGRGLRLGHDGNILVSAFNMVYKLNYKTGAGMNKVVTNTTAASIAAVAVDKAGNMFVATVAAGNPIKIYDKDFNFVANARNKSIGFSRSFEVSGDGNTIYWAGYTNHAVSVYSRPDEFSAYDSLGAVLAGFDSESLTFHPVTGQLWASAGSKNDGPNRYTNLKTNWKRNTWYSFDPKTLTPKDLTDAETALQSITWKPYVAADSIGRPRGLGFTADGKTAYAVQFASGTGKDGLGATVIMPTLQKFTQGAVTRQVTLTLNMATAKDTVGVKRMIQVRGGGDKLPDGNTMTWDDKTTLKPKNIGGDYWQVKFEIDANKDVNYKYWADPLATAFIPNGGWETGGPNRTITGGTGAVNPSVQYFNASGGDILEGSQPFRKVGADSVGVWFRVYMNTEAAGAAGYDATKGGAVSVRGDNMGGVSPLDWGSSKVKLKRESEDAKALGFQIYAGLAVYPKTARGKEQCFKYLAEPSGWESTGGQGGCSTDKDNRSFKIPTKDSTLYWVNYGNSKDVGNKVRITKNVGFAVDLSPLEAIGVFDRTRGDSLQVRGEFNGWGCDKTKFDKCLLDKVPGKPVYELTTPIGAFDGTEFNYKYYLDFYNTEFLKKFSWVPSGWEEPISTTGANRKFNFAGTAAQTLPTATFNDVLPKNILPAGTSVAVKFKVDMKPALTATTPFDPAKDKVYVDLTGDPIWGLTQGYKERSANAGAPAIDYANAELKDADKDGVYEGTITVKGPTYGALQYKYAYGSEAAVQTEEGGGFGDIGRRRTRYIYSLCSNWSAGKCAEYAAWPKEQALPAESYIAKGVLPYEQNKVDVEPIHTAELPSEITLTQNYPNPFNPSTMFEYTLNQQANVKVQVFDLTGRLVATLVNTQQARGTYRVNFDASKLASGTYVYRLQAGNQILTKKMTFVK